MKKKSSFLDREENGKDLGTASFAAVAVLILLLSIAAISYMGMVSRRSREEEIRAKEIGRLEDLKSKALGELKTQAEYFASQSIFEYMEEREREDESVEEQINDRLMDKFNSYLDDKEGEEWWQEGNRIVEIRSPVEEHFYVNVSEKRYRTEDVVPEAVTTREGSFGPTNQTSHYKLTGEFDFKLKNPIRSLHLERTTSFERNIDSPYPFLTEKMSSFESSLDGERSELGRVVKYMLTTLAQYRVGAGYGMDEIVEGIEDDFSGITTPGHPTSEILNKEDVEISVNLAILLLISKNYRTLDQESLQALEANVPGDGTRIRNIIENYVDEGLIDPADLIALYEKYGYDDETVEEDEVKGKNLTAVVSQTLYSVIDQFTLHYLNHFELLPLEPELYEGKQNITSIDENIADWFLRESDMTKGELVRSWVEDQFERAGLTNANLVREGWPEGFSEVTELDIVEPIQDDWEPVDEYPRIPDDFNFEYEMEYKIRQTNDDNSWYDFSCDHDDPDHPHRGEKDHTCPKLLRRTDEDGNVYYVRCGATDELVGYDYKIFHIDVEIDAPSHLIPFETVDILSEDPELWDDFYSEYKEQLEKTRRNIRTSTKEIISSFSENFTEHPEMRELIEQYENIEIDPEDQDSLFGEFKANVDSSVSEVTEYYKENPDDLAEILNKNLYESQQPMIEALKEFIQDNYDELVNRGSLIERTVDRFADHLIELEPDDGESHISFDISVMEDERIVNGDVNKDADKEVNDEATKEDITREDARDAFLDGSVRTEEKLTDLKGEIEPYVQSAFETIKNRETQEENIEGKHSQEDGTVIQALDFYQFEGESYHTDLEPSSDNTLSSQSTDIKEQSDQENDKNEEKEHTSNSNSVNSDKETNESFADDDNSLYKEKVNTSNKNEESDDSGTLSSNELSGTLSSNELASGPTADFDYSKYDKTVYFWDQSAGDIVYWYWEFGDDSSSTSQHPTHTYSSGGWYTVELTVWNETYASDSTSESIYINRDPVADFEWSPDPTREDCETDFDASDSDDPDGEIVDYSWDFGDGGTGSGEEPTYIYEDVYGSEEEFTVELTVTDDEGATDTTSEDVTVLGRPFVTNFSPTGTNVDTDTDIIIEFSEPIHTQSFGYDFSGPESGSISFEESWNDDGDQVTLSPEDYYRRDGTYELELYDSIEPEQKPRSEIKGNLEYSFGTEDYPRVTYNLPYNDDGSGEWTNDVGDVKLGTSISISFDEPMHTYVDEANELINCEPALPDENEWEIDWKEDGKILLMDHTERFEMKTEYTITIRLDKILTARNTLDDYEDAQASLDGSYPPEDEKEWSFITEDAKSPEIVSTTPSDGEIAVSVEETIQVEFDEEIDTTSFSYEITPEVEVTGVNWYEDNTIVNIEHDDFEEETTYKVSIEAYDPTGNALKGSEVPNPWYFTTEDNTPPEIVSISPQDGATGVLTDTSIYVEFSESVNPDSFDSTCIPSENFDEEWNFLNTAVKLDPIGNFEADEEYTFTVNEVEDTAVEPNSLKEGKSVTFYTSSGGEDIEVHLFEDIVQSNTGTDDPGINVPLIPLMEDYAMNVTASMIDSTKMANTEYRLPTSTEDSKFTFWENYTEDPTIEGDPYLTENITIDKKPAYIELDSKDYHISSAEGVHYANVLRHTSRAYETHWEVNLDKQDIEILTESEKQIYLDAGTHHPTWVNRTLDAGFSIRVPVFSAWELKDVDYNLEEEELKEITTVLDEVWEPAKPSLSVMIDTGENLIPFMDNQVNTLRSYDVERIRRMERFLNENMDILKERLEEADIDFNALEMEEPLYLAGRKISFDGERLEVEYEDRSGTYFSTTLTSDYQNNIYGIGQGTIGSVEGIWDMAPGKFSFEGTFNNPEPVGDDWSIEFEAPYYRTTEEEEYRVSDYTDIKEKEMVVGDIRVENVDIGMRLRYDSEEVGDEIEAIIEGKIWETFDNTYHRLNERIGMNQQFIIKFLRTSMLELENKITNLMGDHIEEISFFVELNLEGRNSDIELSFSLVENDGISDFFEWVSRNLDKYVKNLFRDYVDSPPNTLHLEKEITDSIFVEYREKGEKETLVSTNLPTFSELLGGDVGEWRIRYGVKDGEGGDYLLFGNVYEK